MLMIIFWICMYITIYVHDKIVPINKILLTLLHTFFVIFIYVRKRVHLLVMVYLNP